MQDLDGTIVYSASDLVGYLECEHLTTLERAVFEAGLTRPDRHDPELDVLQERGLEHERRYLAHLQDQGRIVATGRIDRGPDSPRSTLSEIKIDAALTRRLMHEGADVIYQATLFDGSWLGYADFLLRVDGPAAGSDLGDYHYEVADTKLARHVKGGALLQMCVYSDLLSRVQGRMPDRMHVALGGAGHRVESHRLEDYLAYFRSVKQRCQAAVATDQPLAYPLAVTPPPVSHCGVCRWDAFCSTLRRDIVRRCYKTSIRWVATRYGAEALTRGPRPREKLPRFRLRFRRTARARLEGMPAVVVAALVRKRLRRRTWRLMSASCEIRATPDPSRDRDRCGSSCSRSAPSYRVSCFCTSTGLFRSSIAST